MELDFSLDSLQNISVLKIRQYLSKISKDFFNREIDNDKNYDTTLNNFINGTHYEPLFLVLTIESDNVIISNHLPENTQILSMITILKTQNVLNSNIDINNQILMIKLPIKTRTSEHSDNNYNENIENLKTLVKFGVDSYFTALTSDDNLIDASSQSILVIKKKISELVSSFQQLQLTIHCPELSSSLSHKIFRLLKDNPNRDATTIVKNNLSILQDTELLNSLHSGVNNWIKQVQDLIQLTHEPLDGTVMDEIHFWNSKEHALVSIESQLLLPETNLTLEILKASKRSHNAITLLSNSTIKDALGMTRIHNQLLKDMPINDILVANDFPKLRQAINLVFNHIKKIKIIKYPIGRAVDLVKCISIDILGKFTDLIAHFDLMTISYDEFTETVELINDSLNFYDDQLRNFTSLARELLRKRSEPFIAIKLEGTVKIKARIEFVQEIRHVQQELHSSLILLIKIVDQNFPLQGHIYRSLLADIELSYNTFRNIDFDLLIRGNEKDVINYKKTYFQSITFVEDKLVQLLKSFLDEALDNPSRLFKIFAKFEFLLNRPHIRLSLQGYHSKLLNVIENNLADLELRFSTQLQSRTIIQMRNIPDFTSTIIWIKQMSSSLTEIVRQLELVLTKDWINYPEGKKFSNQIALLMEKLNTDETYSTWLNNITETSASSLLKKKIFQMEKLHLNNVKLKVNFDLVTINLANEVGCLVILGFEIPRAILSYSEKIAVIYPYAISLRESITNLEKLMHHLNQLGELKVLLIPILESIFCNIQFMAEKQWNDIFLAKDLLESDFKDLDEILTLEAVADLEKHITELTNRTESLMENKVKLFDIMTEVSVCEYTKENFKIITDQIQDIVNLLILNGYRNISSLVESLNGTLNTLFFERCCNQLENYMSEWTGEQSMSMFASKSHHIIVHGFKISLDPSLESSKSYFIDEINKFISDISTQKKISWDSYDIKSDGKMSLFFDDITHSIMGKYLNCIELIESIFEKANAYLSGWFGLQLIWDFDIDLIASDLGIDISRWLHFLQDMKSCRGSFDTIESSKSFGLLVIDFEQAQSRISGFFDTIQKLLFDKFADILEKQMKDVHEQLISEKASLENIVVDLSNSLSAINLMFSLNKSKVLVGSFESILLSFRQGQIALVNSRYRLPVDWIYYEQLSDDYSALLSLISNRTAYIESYNQMVVSILDAELSRFIRTIKTAKQNWSDSKIIDENMTVSEAVHAIESFEKIFERLKESRNKLFGACQLVDFPFEKDDFDFQNCLEEISTLKSVWGCIQELNSCLDTVRDMEWDLISPVSLRKTLEDILTLSRNTPASIRKYPVFEQLQSEIKHIIHSIPLLTNICNTRLTPLYWEEIFKHVLMKPLPSVLLVRHILDLNPMGNEKYFQSILQRAQSEKLLENSINTIKKKWVNISFEIFQLDSKHSLIKGWASLFCNVSEDLSTLNSMKLSPYYDHFSKKVLDFEEKLNFLYGILDKWIEVQRQWIYLYGTFKDNSDIKNLMPIESIRFENVTLEFKALINMAFKSMLVMDLTNIPDISRTLEKLLDVISKIRKSLVSYLEKQREVFPRFYFIGNDDLLELIGNSTDINIISKHLKNMFTGISSLIYDVESKTINGVVSSETEVLMLTNSVSLIKHFNLTDWLKQLENEIRISLSYLLGKTVAELNNHIKHATFKNDFLLFINKYPNQLLLVALQISWTISVENSIADQQYNILLDEYSDILKFLANIVLQDLSPLTRTKVENIIVEFIHHRDIVTELKLKNCDSVSSYAWFSQQRYYYTSETAELLKRLTVKQGTSQFLYGFEYLGAPKKLAYTPLLDTCFVALTEALNQHLGGLLVGPSGTGKTESIKALGYNLGRMVFVFCCDETFDFQSVSRILAGISRIGSWGCFDEFNRLDERMLSAISTQIEKIENCLSTQGPIEVELLGKKIVVNKNTGIFITTNPSYAGRSALPDNLKSKYRTFSVVEPDVNVIADVIFNSQGFVNTNFLSSKIVQFFRNLQDKCSNQVHYDFGLRALKSALLNAGKLKRNLGASASDSKLLESQIVVKSLYDVVLPKFIPIDEEVFENEIKIFEVSYDLLNQNEEIISYLKKSASENGIFASDGWIRKALQVYEIQKLHHGFILVGDSGSGKTTVFKCLLEAMFQMTGVPNLCSSIDPIVLGKDLLFGTLDYATRDWTDGVFTSILRKVNEKLRGEESKNIWIVFDGDVDPNWVENLNSVLDDNKLLTLPSGERIPLPENVRVVFEVDTLKNATPATVSRCGIIWFNNALFSLSESFQKQLFDFKNTKIEEEEAFNNSLIGTDLSTSDFRSDFITALSNLLDDSFMNEIWSFSKSIKHIMGLQRYQCVLSNFFTMLRSALHKLMVFVNDNLFLARGDYEKYIKKQIIRSLIWSFSGDSLQSDKQLFCQKLETFSQFSQFTNEVKESLVYLDVLLPDGKWENFSVRVPTIHIEPHMVVQPDLVIPTVDTACYEDHIFSLLNEHKPLILCGPPGSGKTMLLLSSLRKSSNFTIVSLNFSSETSCDLILKILEQYCVYKKTANGMMLTYSVPGKWLVLFCDEINLPKVNAYGSQMVISFLRQLILQNGFWHPIHGYWVSLSSIQFVGACNPPDDPGRHHLSARFMRACSVIMIDYPGKESLKEIYSVFCFALLRCVPDLTGYSEPLTDSIINFYGQFKTHFDDSQMTHYICSPRELTRWVRGLYEALRSVISLDLEGLVRLWAHEALRLFSDKLSSLSDRQWVFQTIKKVCFENFPHINQLNALSKPILYSDWLSYDYSPVDENELRKFVQERFKIFNEEETNTEVVLYDDLLDHILRVDRVLKNAQGHLILVGPSGSGKTVLTKFVCWINGLSVYQLNISTSYTLKDFDETLRELLLRSGAKGEKTCFIIDESTILETSFLERMNTLLANAEIPGLFEGDGFHSLMNICSKTSQESGFYLDSDEELYQWFTQQVANNFHVVFTIGDPYSANSPQIITSPALFNRCVLNWMGDWSEDTLVTIAFEVLSSLPIDKSNYVIPSQLQNQFRTHREVVIYILFYVHNQIRLVDGIGHLESKSPLKFLKMLNIFKNAFIQKENDIQEYQSHVNTGLDHLKETFLKVKILNEELSHKRTQLLEKDKEAREVLDKMITDQNESERKQEVSIEIQKLFEHQGNSIEERRNAVLIELSEVEPLIEEAQKGVKNIKKQHLTELRSMHNPPEAVKITLESVCILLGYEVKSWKEVQYVIRQDDFIASIVNFDSETQLTQKISDYMEKNYLSRPNYNYEAVNRASKACGPMLLWVQAQLRFAAIIERVQPLKGEMKNLEADLIDTKAKLIAIDGMIKDLHDNIEVCKLKYSETIRDTENIKMEMLDVELKVKRSVKLLESLKDERTRWSSSVTMFNGQRNNLIGNAILSSAFTCYAGSFDQQYRTKLLNDWRAKLAEFNIDFDKHFSILTHLTSPTDVLSWEKCGLPNDNLFIENAAILTSSLTDSFPFIIDPLGLIIPFILNLCLPKQLVVTSFLDPGFVKQLENCVRFGGSILIQDAEHYNPIISRVVAKDINSVGGRRVVLLGDTEVDMASDFRLYIHTRDPTINVLPFLSSRMTVLNFTFSAGTLVNQALNLTLKSEKPAIEQQRMELIKVSGEYKERLRGYEKDLLETLGDSKNSILENDDLAKKLSLIKSESDNIQQKMIESESIIHSFNDLRNEFDSLGKLYARFTVLLDNLWRIEDIYRFANDYSRNILCIVLNEHKGSKLETLMKQLTLYIYGITASSLLQKDRKLFGFLLQVIYKNCKSSNGIQPSSLLLGFEKVDDFEFTEIEFVNIVENNDYLLLRAYEGYDSTVKITQLASALDRQFETYSMGSVDGSYIAFGLIKECNRKGNWLIIENVQMSIELLDMISNFIESVKPERSHGFKLFLTCSVDANIPIVLSKLCHQVIFQNEPGLKNIMKGMLFGESSLLNVNQNIHHIDIKIIYFNIVWYYSLLLEKLRFAPVGFKKQYEINESDLITAKKFIDKLISNTDDTHVNAPAKLFSWDVISTMIGRVIFGGKVDDKEDLHIFIDMSEKLFQIDIFNVDKFNMLICGGDRLLLSPPGNFNNYELKEWVERLPDIEPLSWLGLSDDTNNQLLQDSLKRDSLVVDKLYQHITKII